jgi:hypothetical protein
MRSFPRALWHAWLELIMTSGWFATQFVSMSSVVQLDSRSLYLHLKFQDDVWLWLVHYSGWPHLWNSLYSKCQWFVLPFLEQWVEIIESEHQQALCFMTTCWQSSWITKEWLVWCVSIVCSSTMPGLMELLCEQLWMKNGWCAGHHLQSSWYVGYSMC